MAYLLSASFSTSFGDWLRLPFVWRAQVLLGDRPEGYGIAVTRLRAERQREIHTRSNIAY